MQRWCSKLRSLAAVHSPPLPKPQQLSSPLLHQYYHHNILRRLFHSSAPNLLHKHLISPSLISSNSHPFFTSPLTLHVTAASDIGPSLPVSFTQVRHITLKQRKRKLKSRKPMTPVVSKVKKIKMKSYSSFKGRFRVLHDGQIRRWKEGKRHNAHLKSKKAKRRGRQPGLVPAAYAKVMKKLNFCA